MEDIAIKRGRETVGVVTYELRTRGQWLLSTVQVAMEGNLGRALADAIAANAFSVSKIGGGAPRTADEHLEVLRETVLLFAEEQGLKADLPDAPKFRAVEGAVH